MDTPLLLTQQKTQNKNHHIEFMLKYQNKKEEQLKRKSIQEQKNNQIKDDKGNYLNYLITLNKNNDKYLSNMDSFTNIKNTQKPQKIQNYYDTGSTQDSLEKTNHSKSHQQESKYHEKKFMDSQTILKRLSDLKKQQQQKIQQRNAKQEETNQQKEKVDTAQKNNSINTYDEQKEENKLPKYIKISDRIRANQNGDQQKQNHKPEDSQTNLPRCLKRKDKLRSNSYFAPSTLINQKHHQKSAFQQPFTLPQLFQSYNKMKVHQDGQSQKTSKSNKIKQNSQDLIKTQKKMTEKQLQEQIDYVVSDGYKRKRNGSCFRSVSVHCQHKEEKKGNFNFTFNLNFFQKA